MTPTLLRRARVVPALQRARRRQRPGRRCRTRATRVEGGWVAQRPEGVDVGGPARRLRHLPGPHRPRRPQARGHHLLPGRHAHPGHRGAAPARDHRRRAVQRGVPDRRVRPRRLRGRRGQRRLAPGPHHAGQRAGVDVVGHDLRVGDRGHPRAGSSGRPHAGRGPGDARPPRRRCWPRPSPWPCSGSAPRCDRCRGSSPAPRRACASSSAPSTSSGSRSSASALLGPEGATTEGDAAIWSRGFLSTRCLTIAGGTSEVQRNVIAERLLGLPRDPEPGGLTCAGRSATGCAGPRQAAAERRTTRHRRRRRARPGRSRRRWARAPSTTRTWTRATRRR